MLRAISILCSGVKQLANYNKKCKCLPGPTGTICKNSLPGTQRLIEQNLAEIQSVCTEKTKAKFLNQNHLHSWNMRTVHVHMLMYSNLCNRNTLPASYS